MKQTSNNALEQNCANMATYFYFCNIFQKVLH